jgi:hypothetical protein
VGRRLQEILEMPVEQRPLDLYAALAELARGARRTHRLEELLHEMRKDAAVSPQARCFSEARGQESGRSEQ